MEGYYLVRLIHRSRIADKVYPVGAVMKVRDDRLRVAAHLVRSGTARPVDARTARDVELFELLRQAGSAPHEQAEICRGMAGGKMPRKPESKCSRGA